MDTKGYKALQNGSDIRGVALAVEGGKPVDLTQEAAFNIGAGFGIWLINRLKPKGRALSVAIGRDSRVTGKDLTASILKGLSSVGIDCDDCGMASTPAMFMCCVEGERQYDGGIMVTASHLPMERNGCKFFTRDSGLEKSDISSVLELAAEHTHPEQTEYGQPLPTRKGVVGTGDVMTPYINGLKQKILSALDMGADGKPFEGMHIIVDAGSGAGGFFATHLLQPLGADISGSLYLEPDGRFPFHQPNPENAQAMACITNAVIREKADFGIIFDTDVDRAGAVLPTQNGNAIALDRNRLIAIMTSILHEQYGDITVVTDSITSTGLADFITELGCRHHRFKRGYRNVINEAKRLMDEGENAIFAMETSGHGALSENYFLDDGAYIIVKLLIALVRAYRRGETLVGLIAQLKEPVESVEVRLPVYAADFAPLTENVLKAVMSEFSSKEGFSIVPDNFEGVRVNADASHGDGWFLIRRSLHDPLMPVNIESNSSGGVAKIASALYECVGGFADLDTAKLILC